MSNKMWGGRFTSEPDAVMAEINASIDFDKRLFRQDITASKAHAEMLAITQAESVIGDWRLMECDLYVTKEPCPMCSGATLMSRVKRVVFAVSDPKMGCLGGATDLNALPQVNHHLEITRGVLEQPCLELLQAYFKFKRTEDTSGS